MPSLSIIPAQAVADTELTDTQVRVLCAIGTFSNRLGGNVWASVQTMAKGCALSTRTVQRAVPKLIERGYLRSVERPGRTTVYEIALEPPTMQSPAPDSVVTPPPTTQSPKRLKERTSKTIKSPALMPLMDDLWLQYPKRLTPHIYTLVRSQVSALLDAGVSPTALYNAARRYSAYVVSKDVEPQFVKSMHGFFMDDYWRAYDIQTVQGRTREEWARSGQDVAEFDRLAGVGA